MEFLYFKIDENYMNQPIFQRTLHFKPSKTFIRKKIVQPLKDRKLSLFHLHEITKELFHIAVLHKNEAEVLNCFYDGKQQLFFFERNETLLSEIKKGSLWSKLTLISFQPDNYQLYTKKDLLKILQ